VRLLVEQRHFTKKITGAEHGQGGAGARDQFDLSAFDNVQLPADIAFLEHDAARGNLDVRWFRAAHRLRICSGDGADYAERATAAARRAEQRLTVCEQTIA